MRSLIVGMQASCRIQTVSESRSRLDFGWIPDGIRGRPSAHFCTRCFMTSAVSSTQAVLIRCESSLSSALMQAPSNASWARFVHDRSPSMMKKTSQKPPRKSREVCSAHRLLIKQKLAELE